MTRSSKLTKLENTRRLTRRERPYQQRVDTTTALALGHNGLLNSPMDISTVSKPNYNRFDLLRECPGRRTNARRIQKQKSNRSRARQEKRSSLVGWECAALNLDLSSRIDDIIEKTEASESPCACWLNKKSSPAPATSCPDTHVTSSTQLPELDLSLKPFPSIPQWALTGWPTFPAAPMNKEAIRLLPSQVVTEFGWSDFKRWLPSQPALRLLPPPSFMTATELGFPNTIPRVKLPSPLSYQFPMKMATEIASAFGMPAQGHHGPEKSVTGPEFIFAEPPGDNIIKAASLASNRSDGNQYSDCLDHFNLTDKHSQFVAVKLPVLREDDQEADHPSVSDFIRPTPVAEASMVEQLYQSLPKQRLPDSYDPLEGSSEEYWNGSEIDLFDSPIIVAEGEDGDNWMYLASEEEGYASMLSLGSMFSNIDYPPLPASVPQPFTEEAEQGGDDQHEAIRSLAEDDPYMMEVSNSA